MFNWLLISKNEIEIENISVSISDIQKELFQEIITFDKNILNTTEQNIYEYSELLQEIRDGIYLKHIEQKEYTSSFLTKLDYAMQVIIVNNRIKNLGKDNNFSYTDKEYSDAFKQLINIECSRIRSRIYIDINNIIILTGILSYIEYFLSKNEDSVEVIIPQIFLYGSFLYIFFQIKIKYFL
jgi:hypothetical protein